MRTTTLILGLIAATIMLLGGTGGFIAGSFLGGLEEAFGTESTENGSDGISTTEDIAAAGAFAIVIAILLYVGAGLAKVTLKISTILLALSLSLCIIVVSVDTTSLFAAFYFLALTLTAVCVVLMLITGFKSSRASKEIKD